MDSGSSDEKGGISLATMIGCRVKGKSLGSGSVPSTPSNILDSMVLRFRRSMHGRCYGFGSLLREEDAGLQRFKDLLPRTWVYFG